MQHIVCVCLTHCMCLFKIFTKLHLNNCVHLANSRVWFCSKKSDWYILCFPITFTINIRCYCVIFELFERCWKSTALNAGRNRRHCSALNTNLTNGVHLLKCSFQQPYCCVLLKSHICCPINIKLSTNTYRRSVDYWSF